MSEIPSRKRRYAQRKPSRIKTLLTLGLVLFGTIFATVIAYELLLANTNESAVETTKEGPAAPSVQPATENQPGEGEQIDQTSSGTVAPQQGTGESVGEGSTATTNQTQAAPASVILKPADSTSVKPEQSAVPATAAPVKEGQASQPTQQATETKTEEAKKEQAKPKVKKHVVQKGETLFQLSRTYYGNQRNVKRIAAYNGLDPESGLTVGQVIYIPID